MTEAQNKIKFLEEQNRTINEMLSSCQKNLYASTRKKKGGRRRKKRGGGNVDLTFKKPEVSNTSASGAIQGTIHKQEAGNAEVVALNKAMAGGGKDIVVPQMNQAGEAGNKSISGTINTQLKGAAQAEYDNDVNIEPKPSGMPSGGRRKRRRKRKTKKQRKSRKRRR